MTLGWGSRYSQFTHLLRMFSVVVVTGSLVFVACFCAWQNFAGGGWRGAVTVNGANYGFVPENPLGLGLNVNSCHEGPAVSHLRETDREVEVKVIAFTRPFHGGLDCTEGTGVRLKEPLGDRIVVDGHTGKRVGVSRPIPYPPEDTKPAADWRVAEGPSWPSRQGFSLQLPPGWELRVLEGLGPHPGKVAGEIVGNGARLEFDFGGPAINTAPADNPSLDNGHGYEEISGFNSRLFVSMDPGVGYTGVYIHQSDGPNLHIVGEGLTPEQQRIAVTVFRSIRLPLPEPGDVVDEGPPPIDDPSSK